jgi:hypothetical protein
VSSELIAKVKRLGGYESEFVRGKFNEDSVKCLNDYANGYESEFVRGKFNYVGEENEWTNWTSKLLTSKPRHPIQFEDAKTNSPDPSPVIYYKPLPLKQANKLETEEAKTKTLQIQAVEEVVPTLDPIFHDSPVYLSVMERLVEPERIISFRVPWLDDNGVQHVRKNINAIIIDDCEAHIVLKWIHTNSVKSIEGTDGQSSA